MSLDLTIRNRQRARAVDSRLLRRIITTFLTELLHTKRAELGITLVAAPEMTRLNETFLKHEGSTDVITFNYLEPGTWSSVSGTALHGEIFICVDEAMAQARGFRTTWQSEIVRYMVHGTLHLLGYDDHRASDRRQMKREENRLVRLLASRFPLSRLSAKTKLPR